MGGRGEETGSPLPATWGEVMRYLLINADGYGFTAGINRAIEECIAFGTVRSLSANVNCRYADDLALLVQCHPDLSVGCHINPVVGSPVLPPREVPTLIDGKGEFFYKAFVRRYLRGHIRREELYAEMLAQVERTRELAGAAFSHLDFHMGLHRLPGLYTIFLEVAEKSGVGRIRTHRYRVGMESRFPRLRHYLHLGQKVSRIPKFLWNLWLRRKALARHLAMPDRRVEITHMGSRGEVINVENYLRLLQNLPPGCNEFVVHPGYVDEELRRWSTYLESRLREREVLLDVRFREALYASDVQLIGYRDMPK
ncbi:MAG: ChbG/HpnK family deacetylase [Nitrospinota bacterium]|nr:MAG: ChbG/HpnK family deacetylase [Nitrospinota bacterium]